MPGFKRAVFGLSVAAAIACAPVAPAAAGMHGVGRLHPWGLGRGLFGAVVGLATLPLVVASAALSATAPDDPPTYAPAPAYYPAPQSYRAPPPAYYSAPQTYGTAPPVYSSPQSYTGPHAAYYPRAPLYYSQPRAYYSAPRAYYSVPRGYAPRASYGPHSSYYDGYAGHGAYRSAGYAYPHR